MKRFLLIAVVSIAVIRADPVSALTWTSDAFLVDGFTNVLTRPDGMDVQSTCSSSCDLNFLAERTFTVTSAGTFLLRTVVSFDGESSNCGVFISCLPFASFAGGID